MARSRFLHPFVNVGFAGFKPCGNLLKFLKGARDIDFTFSFFFLIVIVYSLE
ncbi:MAG: hypothetical protein U0487_01105 [Patescibacteria group bacterium]